MVLAFKIALLAAGILFAAIGLDDNKETKAANITGAFMMFTLLWLSLMTL